MNGDKKDTSGAESVRDVIVRRELHTRMCVHAEVLGDDDNSSIRDVFEMVRWPRPVPPLRRIALCSHVFVRTNVAVCMGR